MPNDGPARTLRAVRVYAPISIIVSSDVISGLTYVKAAAPHTILDPGAYPTHTYTRTRPHSGTRAGVGTAHTGPLALRDSPDRCEHSRHLASSAPSCYHVLPILADPQTLRITISGMGVERICAWLLSSPLAPRVDVVKSCRPSLQIARGCGTAQYCDFGSGG